MAAVQLACPLCQGIMEIDSSLAGLQVACPTCQGVVTIPMFEMQGAAYAPPPSEPPPYQPMYGEPPAPAAPAGLAQLGCPLCAGEFQVTPEMSGQQVACPHCQGLVTIPDFSGAPPATEPPATFPPAPMYEPPPGMFSPNPEPTTAESTAAEVQAELQERNLYPPGFEPPPDIKRGKKKKRPRIEAPAPAVDAPTTAGQPFSPPIETMLPQGASIPSPYNADQYVPPAPEPQIDAMLPPGAADTLPPAAAPLRPVVVTIATDSGYTSSTSRTTSETIVIPTEDGELVAVHEPVKTVGKPGQEVELRRLTPEEKARRRLVKNLVMGGMCLVILAVTFFLLKNMR